MEVERDHGSARRRREHRLRSMCHEQLSSAQRGGHDASVQVPEYAAPTLVAEYIALAPACIHQILTDMQHQHQ